MSTTPERTESLTAAQAPFDDARADLILQSSDGVHFRVFKVILSLASPIFADMFRIPSPTDASLNHGDEGPVVRLSECSGDLDFSLRHLYPIRTPNAVPLRNVGVLAEFARKYRINALTKHITRYLADNIEFDPVGVYAIAVTYEFKDIWAKAARTCLDLPFSRLQSPLLHYIAVEFHVELLRYHAACGEAASGAASERNWFSSLNQDFDVISMGNKAGCSHCITQDYLDHGPKFYGPLCLWNYLYRSTLVLVHHPSAKAVTTEEFVLKSNTCSSCADGMRRRMFDLSTAFGKEIKKVVERIPLPKAGTT
ncbi:hypothetical protein F5148DRAFT_1198861 [Russula earlei]|uniref:Uncharacterized protein n=1 Tax=Russula earlei TaxID=71964 RepID=A0ACC0UAK2_9AGAM|nr:hypothetical protein F5148DRAFT_1198861 [Russula earlei]